ncbi:guanylate-binding protein 3-like isoform X2 [Mya arenaria]|uniref:guanylate-binding protein 3-like isoform X2 n=1 Tax=Mya arenaria TaxID=6604 RepID=UPI0022E96A97|nr:guanylate-binding protein 3-like isoform X2 [Mya arenaria]
MIQNESYVDSLANRDLQSQSGKHPEQDETTRKSFSENRVSLRPKIACKSPKRLPTPTSRAKYEKRNIQQDAEYESTTSEDMPTDAYKLKKRQTSPTSSARYKARHYSDSKLAEKLESFSNYEKEHWSEDGLEVFQRPLCLVSAGYKNVLQVDQSVLGQLRKIILPCVIVAVVGLYRTGKSYLMNRLADADKVEGFALGDTIQSQTKGIWVWCKRHPRIADTILVLLDTEGLGDVQKGDPSHDNRIITLATLLCSTLVYNMKGAFDQDAVNKLTFVSEMAKNIRFGGRCDENNSILPGFVLVLRDFTLKMKNKNGNITPDEYLETSLKSDDKHGEDFNKPRESIRKFFPSGKRKCFALPVPGDADVLDKLEELPFDALSKRFQEPTFEFMKFIFNQEPKQLMNSKPVTGSKMENTKVKNAALAIFKEGLVDQKMPVPYKQLDDHFQSVQWTALEYIRKNAMLDGKHNVEKDVQSYMEIIWVNRKSENEQHIFEYCENSLEALQSKSTLIAGIQDKSYADIGGHRKFKHDLERVRQEYNLELKDKGYGNRETAVTWSTFKQTLTDAEMEIVRLDDALSEDVKNREREEFKQEMQKTVREMEEQYKQSFEEQRKSYEAHEKEIKKQRDEQNQEHKEKMNKLIQEIAQLKEYVVECQSRDKKIQLLENENKKIRKMEMQLREENEKKRDEDFRQWRKDEKEQFERTVEDMRTVQQKGDETEKELRNLKEEKERKESERKKLGFFGKLLYGFKEYG